jgi:hypothetical protein
MILTVVTGSLLLPVVAKLTEYTEISDSEVN